MSPREKKRYEEKHGDDASQTTTTIDWLRDSILFPKVNSSRGGVPFSLPSPSILEAGCPVRSKQRHTCSEVRRRSRRHNFFEGLRTFFLFARSETRRETQVFLSFSFSCCSCPETFVLLVPWLFFSLLLLDTCFDLLLPLSLDLSRDILFVLHASFHLEEKVKVIPEEKREEREEGKWWEGGNESRTKSPFSVIIVFFFFSIPFLMLQLQMTISVHQWETKDNRIVFLSKQQTSYQMQMKRYINVKLSLSSRTLSSL